MEIYHKLRWIPTQKKKIIIKKKRQIVTQFEDFLREPQKEEENDF